MAKKTNSKSEGRKTNAAGKERAVVKTKRIKTVIEGNSDMDIKKSNLINLKPKDDKYIICTPSGEVILTHLEKPFPPLGKDLAEILAADLNANQCNLRFGDYRDSLVYCMLSTIIETPYGMTCDDPDCERDHYNHTINLDEMIQWDRAFRLDPNPERMMLEMKVIETLKNFLNEGYKDLSLNYCSSIEEMKNENEYAPGFVDLNIIKKFSSILDNFTRAERFSVDLIYNLMECFSITLSIMLINKQITPIEYYKAFLVFVRLQKSDRFSFKSKPLADNFNASVNNLYLALESEGLKEFL